MLETSAANSRQAAEEREEELNLKKKKQAHKIRNNVFPYMCDSNSILFAFVFR